MTLFPGPPVRFGRSLLATHLVRTLLIARSDVRRQRGCYPLRDVSSGSVSQEYGVGIVSRSWRLVHVSYTLREYGACRPSTSRKSIHQFQSTFEPQFLKLLAIPKTQLPVPLAVIGPLFPNLGVFWPEDRIRLDMRDIPRHHGILFMAHSHPLRVS